MRTLSERYICGHIHDELIIECAMGVALEDICAQMGEGPIWLPGIELKADGYECMFYKKE